MFPVPEADVAAEHFSGGLNVAVEPDETQPLAHSHVVGNGGAFYSGEAGVIRGRTDRSACRRL